MRIENLKISDHPLLGNLELDFHDQNGKTYDSIIIAGENGSGKSTLLELLLNCTNTLPVNITGSITKLDYTLILDQESAEVLISTFSNSFSHGISGNRIRIQKDLSKKSWSQIHITYSNSLLEEKEINGAAFYEEIGSKISSIYSDVAINFKSGEISNVTAEDIDKNKERHKKSSESLATEITQLFVDIASSDAQDLSDWIAENPGQIPPRILLDSRMSRFTSAYQSMFPAKRFNKITNENGKKIVKFKENGKLISLSNFSSGEKQIIFRGAFLLKDKVHDDGAFVFIDEPEISLHPRWQLKILDFYKNLFRNENGTQKSQMFFATHSPFIIHNDSRYNDKVIVIEKDEQGRCSVKDSNVEYFNWSPMSIVNDAFKIDNSEPVVQKTVYLEGELDEEYFKRTIEIFDRKDIKFQIKWVGRKVGKGENKFSGKSGLDKLRQVFSVHSYLLKTKVILYYDNDCTTNEVTEENLLVRIAPRETINSHYKDGIESLLYLPDDFKESDFTSISIKESKGKKITTEELDKRKLCNWIKSNKDAMIWLGRLNNILNELEKQLK